MQKNVENNEENEETLALYLLSEVYKINDGLDVFHSLESPDEQTLRIHSLRVESEEYVQALMMRNADLFRSASSGNLAQFHEDITELRRDEILSFGADRSFSAACTNGHLHVAEYMLRRGYTLGQTPKSPRQNILFEVITNAVDEDEDDEENGEDIDVDNNDSLNPLAASSSYIDARRRKENISTSHVLAVPQNINKLEFKPEEILETVRSSLLSVLRRLEDIFRSGVIDENDSCSIPVPLYVVLKWLVERANVDVNQARTSDGYCPLHLASLNGSYQLVCALLIAGADPNAVSNDNYTPLSCAKLGMAETTSTSLQSRFLLTIAILESNGAIEDWKDVLTSVKSQEKDSVTESVTESATESVTSINTITNIYSTTTTTTSTITSSTLLPTSTKSTSEQLLGALKRDTNSNVESLLQSLRSAKRSDFSIQSRSIEQGDYRDVTVGGEVKRVLEKNDEKRVSRAVGAIGNAKFAIQRNYEV